MAQTLPVSEQGSIPDIGIAGRKINGYIIRDTEHQSGASAGS
jgi:hypothetical protein